MVGLAIIPIAVVILLIAKDVYDSTDHSYFDDAVLLKSDAVPIDIKRDIVGTKGHKRVRTTILFDDGFRYISHKTDIDDHFLSYSISVSASTSRDIIADAIAAHGKAMQKQMNRSHK